MKKFIFTLCCATLVVLAIEIHFVTLHYLWNRNVSTTSGLNKSS